VPVGLQVQRIAELQTKVWFLGGHGPNGAGHEKPYADDAPTREKR
jgi:hypothetical protein